MKNAPNSKSNLDRAIQRFAGGGNSFRANELRGFMANAIVAQMVGDGVVKGGSGLRFRYGDESTRTTMDLDVAWRTGPEAFIADLKSKLLAGWSGFSGDLKVLPQASPRGVPADYVMQPCDVKLRYLGTPWYTVRLEIGHNEIGDAESCDMVEPPKVLLELFDFLSLPRPSPIPAMKLEYQVAQKLHGVSAPASQRVHDLIDLQLIMAGGGVDLPTTAMLCRSLFAYRKVHAWPPRIAGGEMWQRVYEDQKLDLPVLPTVDEAIAWANDLISRIDRE